jgi:Glyoxalase-like domain
MAWMHAVIDVPAPQVAGAASFWGGVLGWRVGPPWRGHPELRSFEPSAGSPYVHLQEVDGPPRVHLDLETDDVPGTVERAVARGAVEVARHDRWHTLRSPGGLPFCLLAASEHTLPEPLTWPDGHRSRMVQVSIDSPAALHEAEVAFWHGLLPGRWAESDSDEFAGRAHEDGSPLQLLLQRLEEQDGVVRAHLDHASDDRAAEVRRLLDLGAEDVGAGRGWHVLRDPSGMAFCVTDNSPESTEHRDLS